MYLNSTGCIAVYKYDTDVAYCLTYNDFDYVVAFMPSSTSFSQYKFNTSYDTDLVYIHKVPVLSLSSYNIV